MTGGGHGQSGGVIMRRPDGTPMTRQEVIVQRRGAFKWLPALCSNDLVHGSWWFVVGSFLTAVFAIYPLCSASITGFVHEDDLLPQSDFELTWAMIIVSGIFYTFGSFAFVRAFEEPPKRALFYYWKHAQSDELLGAWMFLFGTVPFVFYMLIFFLMDPSAFYFFGMIAAIVFVFGCYLFVVQCYPTDGPEKKHENIILPLSIKMFGAHMWVVKHLANDWLAGTWFFLWANIALTFGSFILLLIAFYVNSPQQIFNWLSGTICSFLFLVGSFYYVAGSYPHAGQFYYASDRGLQDSSTHELFLDEISLLPSGGHSAANPLRLSVPNLGYTLQHMNIFEDGPKLHHHVPTRVQASGDVELGGDPSKSTVNPLHGGLPPVVVNINKTSQSTAPVLKPHSSTTKEKTAKQKESKDTKDKTLPIQSAHSSIHGAMGNVSTHSLTPSVISQASVAYQPIVSKDLNRDDDDEDDDEEPQPVRKKSISAANLVMKEGSMK